MEQRIINRTIAFIMNLQALHFNAAPWDDIEAFIGQLNHADKAELGRALAAAGAVYRGKNWVFADLDIDVLSASPVTVPAGPELVTVLAKVPAGTWGKDAAGKVRFVRDPSFVLPIYDADPDNVQDEDSGEPSDCLEPSKGNLNLDI